MTGSGHPPLAAPPIDLAHLAVYTAGDPAFEAEILGLFRDGLSAALEQLGGAADATGWRKTTHKLKGSALAVGAWTLAEIAAEMETAIPGSDQADELFSALKNAADATLDFIVVRHPRP